MRLVKGEKKKSIPESSRITRADELLVGELITKAIQNLTVARRLLASGGRLALMSCPELLELLLEPAPKKKAKRGKSPKRARSAAGVA